MAEPSRCTECGAELTGDSRSGELCAVCLMALALPEVVDREAGREAEAASLEVSARIGQSIGPYLLEQVLGEGGMGVVYLAEQQATGRPVALKVIKPGFTAPSLLRRFEHEAQVLGRLRHPGIAQVYEAGIHQDASSRFPFIAMEYIEGPCITDYARRENLSTRGRLQLVVKICDAVQHAHQKGVIHRDLKPGNILVEEGTKGEAGQPKILDFGVARLTDADIRTTTLRTDVGQLLGTIQYMSPEQAAGDPDELDTRSDVYSLGVICYELLGGRLPYDLDRKMIHEAVRVIREVDPAPLSTVDPVFRGDLNTILAKCLEKDKTRRYASAAALAEDLRRYLGDEPITAHPPSAVYQLRKFARRNRSLVASAAAVLAVLVTATVATSWLAVAATRAQRAEVTQRRRAEERFEDVRRLAKVFLFELDDTLADLAGALPARKLMVETGLEYLDRLAEEADDDPELQQELAAAYGKLGDVQGRQMRANLGDTTGALESYAKAVDLLERQPEAATPDSDAVLRDTYLKLAEMNRVVNRPQDALGHYRKAEGIAEGLLASDPEDAVAKSRLGAVLERLAELLASEGQAEEGLAVLGRAYTIRRTLLEEDPHDPERRRGLAVGDFLKGRFAAGAGQHEDALVNFRSALAAFEPLARADPNNDVYQRDLHIVYGKIGDALMALDRKVDALESYESALAIAEANVAAAPDDATALAGLSIECCHVGDSQLALGRIAAALSTFQRYLQASEARVRLDPTSSNTRRERGVALYKMGEVNTVLAARPEDSAEVRLDRWREARSWFERSHDEFVSMRDEKLLWESDAGVPDDIAGEIAACDTAIAELGARTDTAASGAGERVGD